MLHDHKSYNTEANVWQNFLKCLVSITLDKNYNLFSISTEGPRKFNVLKLKNTPTYKIFRILKTECKYMKTV